MGVKGIGALKYWEGLEQWPRNLYKGGHRRYLPRRLRENTDSAQFEENILVARSTHSLVGFFPKGLSLKRPHPKVWGEGAHCV